MTKERTGVSLDRDVYQTAKTREDVNLSGLVNDLLRTYFEAGGSQRELFKTRLRHKKARRDDLNEELEQLNAEIEALEEIIEEQREAVEPTLENGVSHVKSGGKDALDPSSPFARAQADKAGLTAVEYVEALAERLDGEEWEITSKFKSVDDKRVRFNRDALERDGPEAAIETVG